MDFTYHTYLRLIQAIQNAGYKLLRTTDYFSNKEMLNACRFIILRHDVDKYPYRALSMAELEYKLGIQSSFYFRSVVVNKYPEIIRKISGLGHEIGYHYRDLTDCRGDFDMAINQFQVHLDALRNLVEVNIITMDGAPFSKFDNRDLWKQIDYRDYGVIAEPYLDIDFTKVAYFTDTGRCWDGDRFNVRDKVNGGNTSVFSSTDQIIYAIENQSFPDRAMINVHPQRWTNTMRAWFWEYLAQSTKNQVKRILIHFNQ